MIVKILDHVARARARLREQYKRLPIIAALQEAMVKQIQELEDAAAEMPKAQSIYGAVGVQLDDLGDLLDKPRNGLEDELYRIVLIAKIAENVSNGTAEDVKAVYKLLMRARYVEYRPIYPAGMKLTAIGAQPIGKIEDIKQAVLNSVLGGVSIDLFLSTGLIPFGFIGDPDPLCQGFADLNVPDSGGTLASIV